MGREWDLFADISDATMIAAISVDSLCMVMDPSLATDCPEYSITIFLENRISL